MSNVCDQFTSIKMLTSGLQINKRYMQINKRYIYNLQTTVTLQVVVVLTYLVE